MSPDSIDTAAMPHPTDRPDPAAGQAAAAAIGTLAGARAPTSPPGSTSGRCLCGAVAFAAGLPSRWVAHCHCTRCQRAHGAGVVTWVGLEAERVRIDDPAGALRWYVAETGAERGFCGCCGSPMFFRSSRWPGELHVARALFTSPVDRAPQMHACFDTHVDWLELGDALPRRDDS